MVGIEGRMRGRRCVFNPIFSRCEDSREQTHIATSTSTSIVKQYILKFDVKLNLKLTMSTDRADPSLTYTLPYQITAKIHRDVPPELSPENPNSSAKGKIIVITGGGTGIGAVSTPPNPSKLLNRQSIHIILDANAY